MRTSAWRLGLMTLLASPARGEAPTERHALAVTLGGEVTLVGLTGGARAELLYRPFGAGTASQLRFALGAFAGPEQLFVPFSVGYRAQYRDGKTLQPLVGLGLELQQRRVADLPAVVQFGGYGEVGLAIALPAGFFVAGVFSFDLMILGGPGFGFGPRVALGFRPPG